MHAQRGLRRQFEYIFIEFYGPQWRNHKCEMTKQEWRSTRDDFVDFALAKWAFGTDRSEGRPAQAPRAVPSKAIVPDIISLPPLHELDAVWATGCKQVEFVVDNQLLADIMAGQAQCNNERCDNLVKLAMNDVFDIFDTGFTSRGGYRSLVTWRPREYNSLADALCNQCMDSKSDIEYLDIDGLVAAMLGECSLQFHSDGGCRPGGEGAFAYSICHCLRINVFFDGSLRSRSSSTNDARVHESR